MNKLESAKKTLYCIHSNNIKAMSDTKTNGTLYARVCSVTGRGMWEGYVFADGERYAIDEKSADLIARDYGYRDWQECYEDGAGYWTEWEDEADAQYIEKHGFMYELWELENK